MSNMTVQAILETLGASIEAGRPDLACDVSSKLKLARFISIAVASTDIPLDGWEPRVVGGESVDTLARG